MAYEIVNVLSVNFLVQDVNVVPLAVLDLRDRLDQSLVLLNTLAVPSTMLTGFNHYSIL